MAARTEHDLLGAIEVPADGLWGAHTQRAINNFPLDGQPTIGDVEELIVALLQVKRAAALANAAAGGLTDDVAAAIVAACDELLADVPRDQFPVHHLHGGGGTSANMNVNEVIANVASRHFGDPLGSYRSVHPTEHVNLHQSTNDVFPTACRLAAIARWSTARGQLAMLVEAVGERASDLANEPRLARTCLQDAVEATFGDLFGAAASLLRRRLATIDEAVRRLSSVSLGGGVMGRTDGVPERYLDTVIPHLAAVSGVDGLRRAEHLADAAQHLDDLADVAAALDVWARGAIKIAKDLRLLSSGPHGGLAEIELEPRQAGSSAMPGKVNPVLPEHAVLLCLRASALCHGVASSLDHAELDLNVWESAALSGIVEAMSLVSGAARALTGSFEGLRVNPASNRAHLTSVIPLSVQASAKFGHRHVEALAAQVAGDPQRFRQLLIETLDESSSVDSK